MRLAAFAAIVATGALSVPAAAGDYDNLITLGLPVIAGSVPVYYSPSAEAEATVYAETFTRAVPWLRQQLDWDGNITMAVLDAADYQRVSAFIPYPIPYADTGDGGRLVVMPDRIDSYPGFETWDLDPIALNAALTLHEIGHIVAAQTGILSGNHWVNELIADVFLAGYARAEEPAFTALLNGVPPRFASAGKLTYLHELDALYAGVGLENYAWFQFRLADLADHIVTGRDFAAVIAELRDAFPASDAQVESVDAVLLRLEQIAPGVTALAADMTEPSRLPAPAIGPCSLPPDYGDGSFVLFVENRSDAPLRYTSHGKVEELASVAIMMQEIEEAELDAFVTASMADFRFADALEPGSIYVTTAREGDVYAIEGNGCFVVPDAPSRFVWTGG